MNGSCTARKVVIKAVIGVYGCRKKFTVRLKGRIESITDDAYCSQLHYKQIYYSPIDSSNVYI